MPRPKGAEAGLRNPLVMRSGITVPEWTGVNKENDPGSIGDTQFQDLVNVRLVGGRVDCRGGQEKLNDVPMSGCIIGLFDSGTEWPDDDTSSALFTCIDNTPAATVKSYTVRDGIVTVGAATNPAGSVLGDGGTGVQIFLRDGTESQIYNIGTPGEWLASARFGTTSNIYLAGSSGIGILDSGGAVTLDTQQPSVEAEYALAYYNGKMYSFGASGLYRRDPSSWATMAVPSPYTALTPRRSIVYRGKLYVSGWAAGATSDAVIFICDGTAVTAKAVGAPSWVDGGTGYIVAGMATLNGLLFYSWMSYDPVTFDVNWHVGKFDGYTWTDNWGIMTTTIPAADTGALRALAAGYGYGAATWTRCGEAHLVASGGYLWGNGAVRPVYTAPGAPGAPTTNPVNFHYLYRSPNGKDWSVVIRTHPITEAHGDGSTADMVAL